MPLAFTLFALCSLGLSPPCLAAESPVRYEASHNAMGTVFTVAAYGTDARLLSGVVNEIFDEIDRLDAQMSNYKPGSELSGINRRAASEPVIVEPRLFRLIHDAAGFSEETGGAFDITVGPLMRAWGFFRGQGRVPSSCDVAQVLKRTGFRHLRFDPAARTVRFDVAGIEIDLGGIAKGYAVDRAVEILRAYGVTRALVSSGTSTLYALGTPPGERGWRITLRDPYDAETAADIIYLKNYSLSASGNYEKFFEVGRKVCAHILDPRTGRPAENMLSTAVLAGTATESDALSTGFFVLGVEGSKRYLSGHPDLTVVFYLPAGSEGKYQRAVTRSSSFSLPPEVLAEITGER